MDLDCIASLALARYLFPDHVPVRSRLIHPVARNLYNLYQNHLDFLAPEELEGQSIERIVVVDTRSLDRVREFYRYIAAAEVDTVVFDHHGEDISDIPQAVLREKQVGANTTLIGSELIQRNIAIRPDDATIALTGIYADTGNFTHENVQYLDFQVAAFCLHSGASINLIKTFLNPLKEDHQLTLFHEILNHLVFKNFNGHPVLLSRFEMEKKVSGLAAVVDKVFEVESPDAFFAVFSFKKDRQVLIVARSQNREIDAGEVIKAFGGNGHSGAASAQLKQSEGAEVYVKLERYLERAVKPAMTAGQIMSTAPHTLAERNSLIEASRFLESINHTGVPVVDDAQQLVGFLTLRDIMKGRKAEQMHAPVKAYMTRKVITGTPDITIREVEDRLFTNNIGHLPIISGRRVVGIVTRADYLRHMEESRRADRDFLQALQTRIRGGQRRER